MRTRQAIIVLGVTMLGLLAQPQRVEGQVVRYAVLLIIDASDNVQRVRNVVGGVLSRLSGRDEEPTEAGNFGRFIITGTDPEREIRVYLGYESTIGETLIEIASDLPAVATVQVEYAAPVDREEMTRRLRVRAFADGFTHAWVLRQNSRTDGLITNNFEPLVP